MWLILIVLGVLLAVALVLVVYVVGVYNQFVTLRARFRNAFAQIDVQLKRRYDLIPNLVETCKGFMKHERETLEAVIAARNTAAAAAKAAAAAPDDAKNIQALMGAETALGGTLGRLFALAEAYPDLKANQNMMSLQEELTSTENKIAFARQAFNDSVTSFNVYRESFPSNIIGGLFNFAPAQLFEVEAAEERRAVKVAF